MTAKSVLVVVAAVLLAACGRGGAAAPEDENVVATSAPTTTTVVAQPAVEPTVFDTVADPVTREEPVPEETSIAITTTTTAAPVDERLPRTEADATEEDPVPVGEVVEATPGIWDIAVTAVDLDAAATVLAFADINPEPAAGFQYVLVTLEGTYLGKSVAQPVFEWAMIAGDEEYRPSIPGCGVVPDSIYDILEVNPGQSFRAEVCMPIASSDVDAGVELFLHAPGDDPRYFELT